MNGKDDYLSGSDDGDIKNEVFYTEGSSDLQSARLEITKYSLPRA